jgi:membrane protease YdiL (CAAX protease family)
VIGGEHTHIAAGIGTLAYSAVLNALLPEAAHVPANLAAAATVVTLARRDGASFADLGLSRDSFGAGARVGLTVAAPIVAGIGLAARAPATGRHFNDARVLRASRRRAAYETAVRIPLGTALGEELLFRSALLGLFGRKYPTAGAVAASSLLFGLWHVLPALQSVADNASEGSDESLRTMAIVAGTVAATAAAGVGLAGLRLRSGSILAPVIVHAAINASAFIAARRGIQSGGIQEPRRATQRSSIGHCAAH